MKRWLVGMTAGWLILTGCGKEQQKSTPVSPQQQETATSVAATVEFVGPRNKPLPQVDPFAFEAPLTAGEFRRQSVEGHTTSMQTGGQLVTYKNEAGSVVLTIYYLDTTDEALDTVRFALSSSSLTKMIDEPVYSVRWSFGVAQDRFGGYLAAWSHDNWCFMARTTDNLSVLQSFLNAFPY